jgi:hypothetical protein
MDRMETPKAKGQGPKAKGQNKGVCRLSFVLGPSLALLFVCGLLNAQPDPASASLSEAPVFKYYVWGQVRQPGAYRLGANPDLVELLSAGGGPTDQADITHVVLVRGIDQKRVPLNLKEAIGSGKLIRLTPGDVVIVPRAFWYTFRDELAIVTSLAIFVNLYFTIANGVPK